MVVLYQVRSYGKNRAGCGSLLRGNKPNCRLLVNEEAYSLASFVDLRQSDIFCDKDAFLCVFGSVRCENEHCQFCDVFLFSRFFQTRSWKMDGRISPPRSTHCVKITLNRHFTQSFFSTFFLVFHYFIALLIEHFLDHYYVKLYSRSSLISRLFPHSR